MQTYTDDTSMEMMRVDVVRQMTPATKYGVRHPIAPELYDPGIIVY